MIMYRLLLQLFSCCWLHWWWIQSCCSSIVCCCCGNIVSLRKISKRALVALSLHVKESKEEKRLANKSVDFSFGGRGQYQRKYSNTAKSFISYRSPDANRTHVTRLGQSQTSNVPSRGNQHNILSPSFRLRQPADQRLSPPMQRKYLPSSNFNGLYYVSRGSGIVEQQQTIPQELSNIEFQMKHNVLCVTKPNKISMVYIAKKIFQLG